MDIIKQEKVINLEKGKIMKTNATISIEELIKNKVHWGHGKNVSHPAFNPFIYKVIRGISVIDVRATAFMLQKSLEAIRTIVRNNGTILFVGTKEGVAPLIEDIIAPLGFPYISYKWIPGLLTNSSAIKTSIKKMSELRKLVTDGTIQLYAKKERMKIIRQLVKMEKKYLSIERMTLPHAVFIVDPVYNEVCLREAQILGITTFAIIDSNGDPTQINYPIPANDDSPESVKLILEKIANVIKEELIDRAQKNNLPIPEFKKPQYLSILEYLKKIEEKKKKEETQEIKETPEEETPEEETKKTKKFYKRAPRKKKERKRKTFKSPQKTYKRPSKREQT